MPCPQMHNYAKCGDPLLGGFPTQVTSKICLRIRHIPGKSRILAGGLSNTQWSLYQIMVNLHLSNIRFHNVEMFTTRFNYKFSLYVSPVPDNQAFTIDALSINWNNLHVYVFPLTHAWESVNLYAVGVPLNNKLTCSG